MLRLVFCLFLLRATVVTTKESCDTQSVAEGQPSAVTCHFGQDLNATRVQFTVDRYDLDKPSDIDNRHTVLDCYWPKDGDLTCTNEDKNYEFDLKVSNTLTLKIPSASEIHVGKYVCLVVGSGDSEPCFFELKESETTPSGRTKVTPSTTESINPNGTGIPPEEAQTANIPMIAGIAVAAVVVVVLVIVSLIIIIRRRRKTSKESPAEKAEAAPETPADTLQLNEKHKDDDEREAKEDELFLKNPDEEGDATGRAEDEDNDDKALVNQEDEADEDEVTRDGKGYVPDDATLAPPGGNANDKDEPAGDEKAPLTDKD